MENMHKPNLNKPNIENYAGYGRNAPEAAKALRGTNEGIKGIKQATEMRREHGRAVQDRYALMGPGRNRRRHRPR
jgi:hypothetical protein